MRCECGEKLIEVLGEETIKTITGEVLPFRRRTDYLLCPSCRKLYSVQKMRGTTDYPELLDSPEFFERRGSGEVIYLDEVATRNGEVLERPVWSIDVDANAEVPIEIVEEEPVPLEDQFE